MASADERKSFAENHARRKDAGVVTSRHEMMSTARLHVVLESDGQRRQEGGQ